MDEARLPAPSSPKGTRAAVSRLTLEPFRANTRVAQPSRDPRQQSQQLPAAHRNELRISRDEPAQKKPRGPQQIARGASRNERISASQPRAIERTLTSRIAAVQTGEVFRPVSRKVAND